MNNKALAMDDAQEIEPVGDAGIVDLGVVSDQTKGSYFGWKYELSPLPYYIY